MKPEHMEKLAREIAQSYRRQLATSDPDIASSEFRYREGIRRTVSVCFGAETEFRLSDKVANISRESVFSN